MLVNYSESVSEIFAALADPTRREILMHLSRQGEGAVTDLAKPFPISLPAISRHLKVLEKAKLIDRRKDGRTHLIRVRPTGLEHAQDWMKQLVAGWEFSFDKLDVLLKEERSREQS
jgi:DNA-binding transcriptional ArsR family regulator